MLGDLLQKLGTGLASLETALVRYGIGETMSLAFKEAGRRRKTERGFVDEKTCDTYRMRQKVREVRACGIRKLFDLQRAPVGTTS